MTMCSLVLALLLSGGPPPAAGGYKLVTAPAKRIEAVLTYKITAPKLVAKEWIVVAPRLVELPGQVKVSTKLEPVGQESFDLSPLQRPLLTARVPALAPEPQSELTMKVRYEAQLQSRHLVALKPGEAAPAVAPVPGKIRQLALANTKDINFNSPTFQTWLDQNNMRKAVGEHDVDFGRRVFLFLKRSLAYEYTGKMDRQATAVCKAGKSDCGGMSVAFVAAMRASGVPARCLVGRWATSAKKGAKLGAVEYYQWHVKAEFYAAGVGWVPVDMAMSVTADKSKDGLRFFGHDAGDLIVMHVDSELIIDTIHFGRQPIEWMQYPLHWATGKGSFKGSSEAEDWQVRVLP